MRTFINCNDHTTTMKDGGPAFPTPIALSPQGDVYYADMGTAGGMTLRDYFAAKALTGLLTRAKDENTSHDEYVKLIAEASYNYADALIVQRSK